MRYALVAAVCLALLTSAACAGGTPDMDKESLQMLFEFKGLGALDLDVYAGGLGMRYFIDDEGLAGRFSLNAGYRTDEDDGDKTTTSLFGGSFLIEKFLGPKASVAPYVGIGFAGFYSTVTNPSEEGESKTTRRTIAVPGVAGFQWWFTDGVALGAEYQLAVRADRYKYYLRGEVIGDASEFRVGFFSSVIYLTVVLQ